MKKCRKCGALQSDDRNTCLDCGAVLGRPMSDEDEELINDTISEYISDVSEKTEDFHVPVIDKILGVISIVGLVTCLILLAILRVQIGEEKAQNPHYSDGFVIVENDDGTAGISTGPWISAKIEHLEESAIFSLFGIFLYFIAALFMLFPRVAWYLETLRYRLWFHDCDPSPSYFALVCAKVLRYSCFVIASVFLTTVIIRII